mmetsp:Transcript_14220/g.43021  ORF Transcript_14220/g.43021 Transcript_14220/m.43021 type:complete len:80 (-) Transcript_14220:1080-1319(-)
MTLTETMLRLFLLPRARHQEVLFRSLSSLRALLSSPPRASTTESHEERRQRRGADLSLLQEQFAASPLSGSALNKTHDR